MNPRTSTTTKRVRGSAGVWPSLGALALIVIGLFLLWPKPRVVGRADAEDSQPHEVAAPRATELVAANTGASSTPLATRRVARIETATTARASSQLFSIEGRILKSNHEPVGITRVMLVELGDWQAGLEQSDFNLAGVLLAPGETRIPWLRSDWSDRQSHYSFGSLAPGRYGVFGNDNWRVAVSVVELESASREQDLYFPGLGELRVALTGMPADRDELLRDLVLDLTPVALATPRASFLLREPQTELRVRLDGLGAVSLKPGRWRGHWKHGTSSVMTPFGRSWCAITEPLEFTIEGGETTVIERNVAYSWPRKLELNVVTELDLEYVEAFAGGRRESFNSDSHVTLFPVAGVSRQVRISDNLGLWFFGAQLPEETLTGETIHLEVRIPSQERELICFDGSSGRPLVNTTLVIGPLSHVCQGFGSDDCSTDGDGRVLLRLPEGTYGVFRMPQTGDSFDSETSVATLDWSVDQSSARAATGPKSIVLSVPSHPAVVK